MCPVLQDGEYLDARSFDQASRFVYLNVTIAVRFSDRPIALRFGRSVTCPRQELNLRHMV